MTTTSTRRFRVDRPRVARRVQRTGVGVAGRAQPGLAGTCRSARSGTAPRSTRGPTTAPSRSGSSASAPATGSCARPPGSCSAARRSSGPIESSTPRPPSSRSALSPAKTTELVTIVTTRPRSSMVNRTSSARPFAASSASSFFLISSSLLDLGLGVLRHLRLLGAVGLGDRLLQLLVAEFRRARVDRDADLGARVERRRVRLADPGARCPALQGHALGAEAGREARLQLRELGVVDLADREQHDEEHHQQRHHVGVADQPALVVLVLLVREVLLVPAAACHRARLTCAPVIRPPSSRRRARRPAAAGCAASGRPGAGWRRTGCSRCRR